MSSVFLQIFFDCLFYDLCLTVSALAGNLAEFFGEVNGYAGGNHFIRLILIPFLDLVGYFTY